MDVLIIGRAAGVGDTWRDPIGGRRLQGMLLESYFHVRSVEAHRRIASIVFSWVLSA
jgi:hypothetical protein